MTTTLTEEKKARFAALREAARTKTQGQPVVSLTEALGQDDAKLSAPMSVEDFIAKMGLEGTK
ncbi:MAG: hypothetical protein EOP83_20405 [Verrucomicrobiaceae bacterium]|nr:MAG: hypothetical protein EOP83_20405 [Verrucomicrobiaceae bacterium]